MKAEAKRRAAHIIDKMGIEDGTKHITQLIYFAEGIDSIAILNYWKEVEKEFYNAVNNYTPDKKIRSWLPR
jgi:hypothetical protein